jgi:hypothetical protein
MRTSCSRWALALAAVLACAPAPRPPVPDLGPTMEALEIRAHRAARTAAYARGRFGYSPDGNPKLDAPAIASMKPSRHGAAPPPN